MWTATTKLNTIPRCHQTDPSLWLNTCCLNEVSQVPWRVFWMQEAVSAALNSHHLHCICQLSVHDHPSPGSQSSKHYLIEEILMSEKKKSHFEKGSLCACGQAWAGMSVQNINMRSSLSICGCFPPICSDPSLQNAVVLVEIRGTDC